MAFEQRDNSGTMFHNVEKKNERGPDFSGSLMVGGKLYFLDAWEKQTREGKSMLSVSVKEKTQQGQPASYPQAAAPAPQRAPARTAPKSGTGFDDMDSEIPF